MSHLDLQKDGTALALRIGGTEVITADRALKNLLSAVLPHVKIGDKEVITSARVLQNIASIANDLLSDVDETRDIGSDINRWKNLYLSGLADVEGDASVGGDLTVTGDASVDALSATSLITASAGITFGDETLDDYEEGTWTPKLEGATTAGTHTYSIKVGAYTRIGNVVHLFFRILISALDSDAAGDAIITGLPFTPSTAANVSSGVSVGEFSGFDLTTGYTQLEAILLAQTTTIQFRQNGDGKTGDGVDVSALSAPFLVTASVTYQVD